MMCPAPARMEPKLLWQCDSTHAHVYIHSIACVWVNAEFCWLHKLQPYERQVPCCFLSTGRVTGVPARRLTWAWHLRQTTRRNCRPKSQHCAAYCRRCIDPAVAHVRCTPGATTLHWFTARFLQRVPQTLLPSAAPLGALTCSCALMSHLWHVYAMFFMLVNPLSLQQQCAEEQRSRDGQGACCAAA